MKKVLYILIVIIVGLSQQSCIRHHFGFSKDKTFTKRVSVFPNSFEKGLYKTNIKFLNKKYSGLMFFKHNSKAKETRMVFMSEFGLKFFDFKLSDNGDFTVEYIVEELNNKGLISVLEQDIKLLFCKNVNDEVEYFKTRKKGVFVEKFRKGKNRYYYFFNIDDNKVSSIEYSSRVFKNIEIDIKEYKKEVPSLIEIKHVNISLKLQFKLIR